MEVGSELGSLLPSRELGPCAGRCPVRHVWSQSALGCPGGVIVPASPSAGCWPAGGLGWPCGRVSADLWRTPSLGSQGPWEKAESVRLSSLWGTSWSSGRGLVLGTCRESWLSLWRLPAPTPAPGPRGCPVFVLDAAAPPSFGLNIVPLTFHCSCSGKMPVSPGTAHRLRVHVVYRHVDTWRDKGQVESLKSLTT